MSYDSAAARRLIRAHRQTDPAADADPIALLYRCAALLDSHPRSSERSRAAEQLRALARRLARAVAADSQEKRQQASMIFGGSDGEEKGQ